VKWLIRLLLKIVDAIYTSEKRTFVVEYNNGDLKVKAERSAVLSSFIQVLDLRPYTFINTYQTGKNSLLLCLLLLCLLMISMPIHYKFFFKKNNIKKYRFVKDDYLQQTIDPYTYETFQDEHDIVVIDDKILLLETWKTLLENEEVKNNPDYAYLFHKKEKGIFFKPTSTTYQYLHNAWFGMLSACATLLLVQLLQQFQWDSLTNFFANIFDAESQLSGILKETIVFGACFGLCFYTITALSVLPWKIFKNPLLHVFKNALAGTIFYVLIFFEATLLGIYLNVNHFINAMIAWLFVGLNTGILTAYLTQNCWKKGIQKGLLTGFVAFVTYLVCFQLVQLELLKAAMACFFNLAIFAALLIAGSYQVKPVTPKVNEVREEAKQIIPNQTIPNKI